MILLYFEVFVSDFLTLCVHIIKLGKLSVEKPLLLLASEIALALLNVEEQIVQCLIYEHID